MDGMLSQDEINALLNGMNTDDDASNTADTTADTDTSTPADTTSETAGGATSASNEEFSLDDSEKDAVGEISNISMGTAATTLSSLLNQKVNITTPMVAIATWDDLATRYDRPCVMMQISYKEGLDGNNVLILKEKDVKIITDLMMGGVGEVNDDEPLSELHLSAIGEAMNQMMGSAATSMSSMFNRKIDISPPVADLIETYGDITQDIPAFLNGSFVMVAFKMTIGELVDSEIMQLYPIEFARELIKMFGVGETPEATPEQQPAVDNTQQQAQPQMQMQQPQMQMQQPQMQMQQPQMQMQQPQMQMQQPQMQMQQPQMQMQQPQMDMQQGQMQMPYGYAPQMPPYGYAQQMPPYGYMPPQQNVNVQSASFQPFAGDINALSQQENIDLIKEVPLEVTVELGRTTKSIKEILEFAPGTIVELNKIAGETIDLLVNGRRIAKGEVVVIEESFGVRITEIIKDR